jgi:hypothetical protein
VHAEGHLSGGQDFDRRIALISFDNAIEVAITTYLTLHPIQRGNRTYPKEDVERWLDNFHSKLDFLDAELRARQRHWVVERAYIVWSHDHRNEQYHGGNKGTPEKNVLAVVRKAALWIFGVLFDVADVEQRLAEAIASASPPSPPQPVDNYDRAIDAEYGMIQVGGQSYYASEVLFSVDHTAYKVIGARLCDIGSPGEATEGAP